MSVLRQKVSYFNSYRDVIPKDVILIDFLTSDKYKKEVDKIRTAPAKQERDKLKSQLPAITPSGLFHTRRAVDNLVSHTGLIQIDIDAKDNPDIDISVLKYELSLIDNICFAAYSVSGKGLFALIPISNPTKHKEHFLALEQDFKEDFNIVIDRSCKDVSRLRGYSYDSDYYINEDAIIYSKVIEVKPYVKPSVRRLHTAPITDGDTFFKALKLIEHNHIDITGDNEQWFTILCAIANEYGEAGRGFAHIISQYSILYDGNKCDKDYNRALKSNYSYSIGTFYYYLKPYLTA